MPAELDNIDSEMDQPEMDQPEIDSEPVGGTIGLHGDETDREGAMAKADLFKIANYAHKLYQQLEDNDQLESWVQAKITKAADYIASVYHYLEYEMKFSEYGHHLDNSDTLSEGQKMRIKELLSEAKSKVKELKKAQAEKVSEEKSSTGGEIDRKTKGVTKHKENPNRFSDEPHTEPKSQAKSQSAADKAGDKAADKAEEKEGKNWEKRFGKDSVTRVKDGKKVDEGIVSAVKSAVGLAKKTPLTTAEKNAASHAANKGKNMPSSGNAADDYDYFTGRDKTLGGETKVKEALKGGQKKLDTDNDNDIDAKDLANLRAKKKDKFKEAAQAKCNSTAKGKSCPVHGLKECGMYEAAAPTKDMPKKGSKVGKEGNAFGKAVQDAKASRDTTMTVGGKTMPVKESNKAVAAEMWKNMKETTAYMAERKKKEKVTDENLTVVPNPSGADSAARAKELGAMMPAPAGKKDPISTTKESIDLARMRQLTGRLNQNEKPALVENREVDQIRALTKRLLG